MYAGLQREKSWQTRTTVRLIVANICVKGVGFYSLDSTQHLPMMFSKYYFVYSPENRKGE